MIGFRTAVTYAGLAFGLVAAGCAGTIPRTGTAGMGTTPVEGQWIDAQGVALSTFSGGQFVTVATDTGNRLSEGAYRMLDRQNVEISMTSLIRQTQTQVNCALVSPTQLNCTNTQGQNFVLTRRS